MHVLLVEDDLDLGSALQQALAQSDVSSEWVRRAVDAQRFVARHFDAILLDLNLPDGNGLSLLEAWRRDGVGTPLIVITANDGLDVRLAGLHSGADDFLVKPFAVPELVARLHAVTRRQAQQAASAWQFGGLVIDMPRRTCLLDGHAVQLSPREFDILAVLARATGAVVPKHRLAEAIAPLGEAVDFNAIEVHVSNLRKKLGAGCIRTLRGVGYQIVGGAA
jgi:two-component system, OmpR family, response regulator QseB